MGIAQSVCCFCTHASAICPPTKPVGNEGNLINNINACWDEIAYVQIGDNPGRKEPTTGEINYKNIFKLLYDKGYKGVMGMEHGNFKEGKEGELALIKAYRESDNF